MCSNCTVLRHMTGRFEENNVRVSELNVSLNIVLKQVVTNINSFQYTMSSSCNNIKKCF